MGFADMLNLRLVRFSKLRGRRTDILLRLYPPWIELLGYLQSCLAPHVVTADGVMHTDVDTLSTAPHH
jgi:hypothetical protein